MWVLFLFILAGDGEITRVYGVEHFQNEAHCELAKIDYIKNFDQAYSDQIWVGRDYTFTCTEVVTLVKHLCTGCYRIRA